MTWGDIFNKYRRKGHDHADAAYRADQWEKRQRVDRWKECPNTHCERSGECRSPNDCSASGTLNQIEQKRVAVKPAQPQRIK